MNEEEIIKVITYKLNMKNADVYAPILYDEIQSLLDLYNKEKEKTPESIRKQFEIYENRICELEEAIKELKEKNKENIKCIEEWINGERMSIHCIHKDSIRAKIEGLEEEKKIRPEFLFSVSRFIIQGKIQGYKELLEE